MELVNSIEEMQLRARQLKAFVFDWDGVFNGGFKDLNGGSQFSESGSMGVNMVRFSAYLKNGELPYSAIISGKENPYAVRFSEREHMHGLYMGYSDKKGAFADFLRDHSLQAHEVAFVYDDILDLNVAAQAGLRIMIGGDHSDILQEQVIERGEVDAITTLSGEQNGLRQACEFIIELIGNFSTVVDKRVSFDADYRDYLEKRNTIRSVKQIA